MNKRNRLVRIVIAAVLALPMAGTSAAVLSASLGFAASASWIWLPALAAVLFSALAAGSGVLAAVSAALSLAAGGAALWMNAGAVSALRDWLMSLADPEVVMDAASLARAGRMLAAATAVVLSAAYFAMLFRRGGTPFALVIFFGLFIVGYASSPSMAFGVAVPGLLAAVAAFALSGELPRDTGAWRVLAPTALAVVLALLLVPSGRVVWEPLERAAQVVRMMFEDYFRFTEERVPYTISTEGYNHAAEVKGEVVALLGGPANPEPEPAMRVTADAPVLLRGSIRRTYTGNSWEDASPKARYLYYDFTRGGVRAEVFSMEDNEAFVPVDVEVEMLAEGTSSLFVTGRLASFDMSLDTAVYYNSIGELFLSRRVQAGDRYSFTGWQAGPELRAAVAAAQADGGDAEALEACLQLPEGIEPGVYELVASLTAVCENDYDRAAAIAEWLSENCAYVLDPVYPDAQRDFVSQFVLETREGYCSYFASAMAVMCRIAGVPARYVEGYAVPAGEGVVVTGENAHAWAEVYFDGIGWVALDPSTGSGAGLGSDAAQGGGADDTAVRASATDAPDSGDPAATPPSNQPTLPPEGEPSPSPQSNAPTPTPQGSPSLPPEASPSPDAGEPTPTLPPDAGGPTPTLPPDAGGPTPTLPPDGADAPPPDADDPPDGDAPNRAWWIALIALLALALIAAAVLWVRARLRASDPLRLSAAAPSAEQAAMILYRAILTLLAQAGQAPLSGETPGAFARRVAAQPANPDFVAFADAVALLSYGRVAMGKQALAQGRRAYAAFLHGLKRGERLRFALTRVFRGLGDFSAIP